MTPLVQEHMTWHRCLGGGWCSSATDDSLRTTGWGRRLGGRVGRRTAALTAHGKRRHQALSRRLVAVTDPTWCGHVWPGGGGQR